MHEIEHASYQQAEFALVTGEDIGSIGAGRHGEIGCVPPDLRDYDDAVSGVDEAGWRASMAEERRSLIEHGVFKWVDPPDGIQAIPSRFLCRWKYNQGGVACRQKSRVVVQNFREADTGADKAAPVASQEPVQTLIANAVKRDLILRRPDVKTAFLQTGMGGCVDVCTPSLPKDSSATRNRRIKYDERKRGCTACVSPPMVGGARCTRTCWRWVLPPALPTCASTTWAKD